jgi:tetratricopeptide (TPR) repeat protein
LYITQQAIQAERAIVGTIQVSNKALRDKEPAAPELLQRLREGVEINPHYRKLTILAADQLLRLGDLEGALWATESVVASRPYVPDLWANLVLLNHHFGRWEEAQAAWEQLHRLQPDALRTQAMAVLLKQDRP